MRKLGYGSVCVAVLWCLASGQVLADRTKAYSAQTTKTFVNDEAVPAFGLVVSLSAAAEIKTDAVTGRAGPFRDVRGNGTGTITLTNAESPVEPGSEAIELVFGTHAKKLSVKSWWWIDAEGKRIGKKKKNL